MGSCLSGASSSLSPHTNYHDSSSSSLTFSSCNRNYSRDSSAEMRLHRIPGRVFLNGSSPFASLFCRQGGKGVNQDAMLLWEMFGDVEDTVFCGVFDGHGPHGHLVAKKVRDFFPLKIMEEWNSRRGDDDDNTNSKKNDNFKILRESFFRASKFTDKELKHRYAMESFGSGTTSVTLFKKGQELVIANIGDSRAVLATLDSNGSLKARQLTTDLKPNLPREAERIRMCKGRVFALNNESDVARLWLPKIDSPGLAMSRAFGDFCLKNYGLISVPEVAYHHLADEDQFVVLATDGIWDVLSNKEVVKIVASSPRASAAKTLVDAAVNSWKTTFPTSKLDDCSAVCLFFHANTNVSPSRNSSIVVGEKGTVESHGKTKQRHQ